jgi:hypothetical protein
MGSKAIRNHYQQGHGHMTPEAEGNELTTNVGNISLFSPVKVGIYGVLEREDLFC